ncbi:hypothetical protein H4R34_003963 [Dimargaris verticillata]|uniref:Microtubule associated protein-domain-containing protein n=1 Tax=Dimargaris verticillata TaxID=2761393 RepID=A0A9W8B543_9FUNG|nr:hypothetical protein H4R34_003963 [Dimargaris verticillata]
MGYLQSELTRRKNRVGKDINQLRAVTTELQDTNYVIPTLDAFSNHIDAGDVAQITSDLHKWEHEREKRHGEFNTIISRCWTAWSHIRYAPVDDLDAVLADLFNEYSGSYSSNLADIHPLTWYRRGRASPLTLAQADLQQLRSKMAQLESRLAMNRTRKEEIVGNIHKVWAQAEIPEDSRITIPDDFSDSTVRLLETTYQELKAKFAHLADSLYDQCRQDLEPWWNLCQVPYSHRDATIDKIRQTAVAKPAMDTMVQTESQALQTAFQRWKSLFQLLQDRKHLIKRMVEFEKSASDPRRLFQSSFRLNEEERFRKTCYPTLLGMEHRLHIGLQEFNHNFGFAFRTSPQAQPYVEVLQKDIDERIVNETVFGFEQPRRHGKRPSISAGSSAGVGVTTVNATSANIRSGKHPSPRAAAGQEPMAPTTRPRRRSIRPGTSRPLPSMALTPGTTCPDDDDQYSLKSPTHSYTSLQSGVQSFYPDDNEEEGDDDDGISVTDSVQSRGTVSGPGYSRKDRAKLTTYCDSTISSSAKRKSRAFKAKSVRSVTGLLGDHSVSSPRLSAISNTPDGASPAAVPISAGQPSPGLSATVPKMMTTSPPDAARLPPMPSVTSNAPRLRRVDSSMSLRSAATRLSPGLRSGPRKVEAFTVPRAKAHTKQYPSISSHISAAPSISMAAPTSPRTPTPMPLLLDSSNLPPSRLPTPSGMSRPSTPNSLSRSTLLRRASTQCLQTTRRDPGGEGNDAPLPRPTLTRMPSNLSNYTFRVTSSPVSGIGHGHQESRWGDYGHGINVSTNSSTNTTPAITSAPLRNSPLLSPSIQRTFRQPLRLKSSLNDLNSRLATFSTTAATPTDNHAVGVSASASTLWLSKIPIPSSDPLATRGRSSHNIIPARPSALAALGGSSPLQGEAHQ